jgi:uncharacterized protein (DUF952 family)
MSAVVPALALDAVTKIDKVVLAADGRHMFPPLSR